MVSRRASRRQASFSELTENFERLNVQTDSEAAAAAHRAASARRASISQPIRNPFSPVPIPATWPPADSDVSMEDVSRVVLNAPSLPEAPLYRGSTFGDHRTFMRAYGRYTAALAAYQTPANRPFVLPVSACIEGDTRRIAMFDFGCSPESVTEVQWETYFLEANTVTVKNYVIVDEAMKALRMDTSLQEAQSRMSRLQGDLYKILEAHNLAEEMFTEAPRRIVGYLLNALEPVGFREIVRHQLTMETNKDKKKQIVPFCKWVTTMLVQYMQWNDTERAYKSARTATTKYTTRAAGKSHSPPTSSNPQKPATPPQEHSSKPRQPTLPCLKCRDPDHFTRDCPQIAPGKADKLIEAARARRRDAKTRQRVVRVRSHSPVALTALPPPPAEPRLSDSNAGLNPSRTSAEIQDETSSMNNATVPTVPLAAVSSSSRGLVPAIVDGLPGTATLLDSGADVSMVSRGTVVELQRMGIEVDITKAHVPMFFEPVEKQPLQATHRVRFRKVSLETSAGPLILRHLTCWVDESDADMGLTVGRPSSGTRLTPS
ncbi:hypothetical protein V7S43_005736 [Phytophthora oleae]|uniref:CCHC-type domain-containing protein n=1 Tax=Phytophthora oleae TaxID=2107226 RepID=A0ABD3FR14_9STRA